MSQNPYGQPPQQYGQTPQHYGQNPMTGAPAQGYVPVAAIPAYGTPPTKKPSTLGVIALVLVVVCGVILSVFMWKIGAAFGPYMSDTTTSPEQDRQIAQDLTAQVGVLWPVLATIGGIGGFVGWILGIVATATKRGRGFGVTAIVLGVLAPIIVLLAMAAALSPYLS